MKTCTQPVSLHDSPLKPENVNILEKINFYNDTSTFPYMHYPHFSWVSGHLPREEDRTPPLSLVLEQEQVPAATWTFLFGRRPGTSGQDPHNGPCHGNLSEDLKPTVLPENTQTIAYLQSSLYSQGLRPKIHALLEEEDDGHHF